jgi:hypothetical protein
MEDGEEREGLEERGRRMKAEDYKFISGSIAGCESDFR